MYKRILSDGALRRVCIILCLIVLQILLLCGCGTKVPKSTENNVANKVEETAKPVRVKTPVGKLDFPGELGKEVEFEETTENNQQYVRCYGEAAGEEVLLFELSFGDKKGNYLIGSVPDSDGKKMKIWLNVQELDPGENWTEDETEQMNLLQSCVNDLLEQIYDLDGFVPAE